METTFQTPPTILQSSIIEQYDQDGIPFIIPQQCGPFLNIEEVNNSFVYPQNLRDDNFQGSVTIEILFGIDGSAILARVDTTSSHVKIERAKNDPRYAILENEAVKLGQKYIMNPVTIDGKPTEFWLRQGIVFKL